MKLELNSEESVWLIYFLRDLAESRSSLLKYDAAMMDRLKNLVARAEAAREASLKDPGPGAKVLRLVKSQP